MGIRQSAVASGAGRFSKKFLRRLQLEERLEEVEDPWLENSPNGVSRHNGELMIRCSGCGFESRGFASESTATDALANHQRSHSKVGPGTDSSQRPTV